MSRSQHRDKITTGGAVPLLNTPINDDSWNAFLFAIYYDPQSAPSDPVPIQRDLSLSAGVARGRQRASSAHRRSNMDLSATPADLDVQLFYDSVSSGIRPRFSVISRADLIAWASSPECQKVYETCKEMKAWMDNPTDQGGQQNALPWVQDLPTDNIPDLLLARVLKTRLLALKQEGIDAKNALKQRLSQEADASRQGDAPDPSAKPGAKSGHEKDAKDAGKDGKKDKDDKNQERLKNTPKKPAKGTAKPVEVPSRPETALPPSEPASKRKNKLKDRPTKSDSKTSMHGDEPLDGPDAYYLLKDLNTPNFLTAMMDDTDLQLNCIVRIDGDPEKPSSTTKRFRIPYSNFGTNNALIAHVRKQYDAAPDDSLWRQCGWINVDLAKVYVSNLADSRNQDNPKGLGSNTSSASGGGVPDPKQLVFDHVAKRIYCVLETRKMYEEYFDRTLQVHVPSMYALSPPDMRYYEHVLESVPAECSAQPEVLVALMLEHLMNSMDEEGGAGALAGVEVGDELGALQRLFEGAASRLLEVVPKAREEVDVDPVTNAQDAVESKPVNTENLTDRRSIIQPPIVFHRDDITKLSHGLETLLDLGLNPKSFLPTLLNTFQSNLFRRALEKFKLARTTMNAWTSLSRERVLKRSQMLQITSLPLERFDRTCLMLEFEAMLGGESGRFDFLKKGKGKRVDQGPVVVGPMIQEPGSLQGLVDEGVDLGAYCWVERLDPEILTQIMESAGTTHGNVRFRYSARDGSLLIAYLGPGYLGKERVDSDNEIQVKTKVGFGLFLKDREVPISSLGRPPASVSGSMMDFQSSMNLDEPTRPPKPTAPLPRISSYFYACRDRNLDTREKCTTLYPCDGARIQVSFTENQHTRNDFKTLWSWNENIVSWGSYSRSIYGAYVTAVFRDQTVFTCAYPQPENTVATSVPTQPPATAIPTVQISTSDGLVVQFLPSGNVLQRFVPPKARAKAAVSGTRGVLDRAIGKEIGRVFTYKGAIVRYMEDDMVITQFPNGAYSSKTGNVWTTIRVDGSRVVGSSICLTSQQQQPAETSEQAAVDPSVTDAAENAKVDAPNANQGGVEELPRIRVSQETNLSSKELMITREDLVHVAVREEFGIVSCTHADGSTIESRFALGRLESAEELLGRTDPESIKIHAGSFATVAFGEFVGGGIERKPGRVSLTLPDGTSVEYGVKNAEHVALRDDVMVSVNMKGHMKITKQYLNKTSTRSDPPSRRRTAKSATVPESKPVTPGKVEEAHSYSANWFDGTLHHVDAFGTVFEVDRFGNASSIFSSIGHEQQNKSTEILRPGKCVEFVCKKSTDGKSLHLQGRNIPRLFVICEENGAGYELLRDTDLSTYFRDCMNDPTCEIREESVPDDANAVGVTVLNFNFLGAEKAKQKTRGGLTHADNENKPIVYRQLVRYPPVSEDDRKTVINDLLQWKEMRQKLEERANIQTTSDGTDLEEEVKKRIEEDLQCEIKAEQSVLRFGVDRVATYEAIMNKFRDEIEGRAPAAVAAEAVDASTSMDGDKTVRNPAKRSGLREDLKESFIVQVKSAALKQLQEGHMIPSYFESPEGRAFLEANPAVLRRELTPRARLNEEHRADKSLESLEEPQLQDEAIEAVGTCQIDQPALLESRIALSEVKRSAPIKHTKKPTRVRSDTPPSRPARLPALPEKNPLEVDVIGQPRQRKVLLPKAIKRGKPGAIPNEHFLKVDAPSRRFVANAATAGLRANTNDRELKVKLNSLGSFEAFPEKCYFGKLRNGSTYEFKLQITNTGLDSTRFSIRQPKNKCIKVFFKPGPVAPGLQANLTVELQANLVEATSKDGQIHDLFQVVSESEILTIPVEARCLEENVYDHLAPALRATVTLKDVTAPFCKADSKSK